MPPLSNGNFIFYRKAVHGNNTLM